MPITSDDAHRTWITAEKIKRVSDRLIGLGPFSVGLDGLLAWVPVAGTLYSLGAGAWLLLEAARVKASAWTAARMLFYVGFRTLVSVIPLEGWLVDFLFRGHMFAANALQKDIVARYGPPPGEWVAEARSRPFAPPRKIPSAAPLPAPRNLVDLAQTLVRDPARLASAIRLSPQPGGATRR